MKRLPFEKKSRMINGTWREVAHFTCARCGGHADLRLVGAGNSWNPEATVKLAVEDGWDASLNSTRAECPRCVGARKTRAAGESPGPKRGRFYERAMAAVEKSTSAEVIQMSTALKPLSSEQRLRIRALLDKHFDDGAGRYLDGYSDHRIATELDLPRLHVETIREAAYGAIRVPPEMEAAERAVKVLESKLPDAQRLCDQIQQLLTAARESVDAARKALAA